MKYKKQTKNTCLAYAMWQVGMIGDEALEEYRITFGHYSSVNYLFKCFVEGWLNKWTPDVPLELVREVYGVDVAALDDGTGIVILKLTDKKGCCQHAISYEDGMLLDPAYDGVKETYEELIARYAGEGYRLEVINVIPKAD